MTDKDCTQIHRIRPTDSTCRQVARVLTSEIAEGLKNKPEAKFEAELEAKLRLENNQKEKAFRDAVIASPLGGVYEAASVAEHEGGLWSPLMFR